MEYKSLTCVPTCEVGARDILVALLAEIGFESFSEKDDGTLLAYIATKNYTKDIDNILKGNDFISYLQHFSWENIEDKNWNEVWESQYQPVLIDECYIRAPFHQANVSAEYEVIIMPKMSFGTAHHETTKLMIKYLLETAVSHKSFLDMGCGTSVLAILAAMKYANPVVAIDNDEWAYNNSLENVKNNNKNIEVLLGDKTLLSGRKFDVIFANINRNILLADMDAYANSLNAGGKLFMSGFYVDDLKMIKDKAISLGLTFQSFKEENKWVAAHFNK